MTEYLRAAPDAFDVIVSADTLVYFGALEDVLAAAAGAFRPGGLLIFTLEHGVGAPRRTIISSCTADIPTQAVRRAAAANRT